VEAKFRKWLNDAMDLYEMAELPREPAVLHLTYLMLMGALTSMTAGTATREAIHDAVDATIDAVEEVFGKGKMKNKR
jgi:hypothetical protein